VLIYKEISFQIRIVLRGQRMRLFNLGLADTAGYVYVWIVRNEEI
jgi:hypothetical protein